MVLEARVMARHASELASHQGLEHGGTEREGGAEHLLGGLRFSFSTRISALRICSVSEIFRAYFFRSFPAAHRLAAAVRGELESLLSPALQTCLKHTSKLKFLAAVEMVFEGGCQLRYFLGRKAPREAMKTAPCCGRRFSSSIVFGHRRRQKRRGDFGINQCDE
jgi:hypothetical protein